MLINKVGSVVKSTGQALIKHQATIGKAAQVSQTMHDVTGHLVQVFRHPVVKDAHAAAGTLNHGVRFVQQGVTTTQMLTNKGMAQQPPKSTIERLGQHLGKMERGVGVAQQVLGILRTAHSAARSWKG